MPCVPGYQGEDQSDERLAAEAGRIGFPVMVKAAAGGGGRGMRLVSTAEMSPTSLRPRDRRPPTPSAPANSFWKRPWSTPRHVEVQVFGDRHGNVIHLGERDCSVQRRHQKVIEEAPRRRVARPAREMGAAAVAAAKAIGYRGAGTVEFLLDASGEFYFLAKSITLGPTPQQRSDENHCRPY